MSIIIVELDIELKFKIRKMNYLESKFYNLTILELKLSG